jgi:hypothetical protein
MDSLSCFLHNVNSTSRIQDAWKCTFTIYVENFRLKSSRCMWWATFLVRGWNCMRSLLSQRQSTTEMHSTKTGWKIGYIKLSYIVPIWMTDSAPADALLKILMLEFCKSWKLSHGLRFERSLSSSRFLRRRCISIEPLLSTWKADISNGFPICSMMIWEQNDWRMPNRFSTSCRHKRDAIFEI